MEKQIPQKLLSPEQLTKDFSILKESFESGHAGLYRYTPKAKIDSAFMSVKRKLNRSMTELEFFRLLVPLIDLIHDAHTPIDLSTETFQYIRQRGNVFPLDIRYINGVAFVEKNFDSTNKSVQPGSEVISINGINMKEITERVLKVKSTDGYNRYPKYEAANVYFWLMYIQMADKSGSFKVKLKDPKTQLITTHSLKGVSARLVHAGQYKVQKDKFTLQYLDSGRVALMSIPSFLDLGLISQFAESFKEIKNRNIQTLIIDIRDNSGGYDELNTELLSYLIPRPFKFYRNFSYRAKDWSDLKHTIYDPDDFWNPKDLNSISKNERDKLLKAKTLAEALVYYMRTNNAMGYHYPKKENFFSGETYLLFNGRSASSGGEVPALLHFYGIGTLIGEEPNAAYEGTTAGVLTSLVLPASGIRTSVPLIAYENNVLPGLFKGHGAPPHFEVSQKLEDAIKNIDTVLEFTLRLINTRNY